MASFQAVTGPKTDSWLVKMVRALAAVIGGVILVAGVRRRATTEVQLLTTGSAHAFLGFVIHEIVNLEQLSLSTDLPSLHALRL